MNTRITYQHRAFGKVFWSTIFSEFRSSVLTVSHSNEECPTVRKHVVCHPQLPKNDRVLGLYPSMTDVTNHQLSLVATAHSSISALLVCPASTHHELTPTNQLSVNHTYQPTVINHQYLSINSHRTWAMVPILIIIHEPPWSINSKSLFTINWPSALLIKAPVSLSGKLSCCVEKHPILADV